MDKFIKQFEQQLQENPNTRNHLNNPNTNGIPKKNTISNYFKIRTDNKPNEISIDCSSDEDIDIEVIDDNEDDIKLLFDANNNRKRKSNMKLKQKSLTQFLKDTDEINKENVNKEKEQKHAEYHYLYVPPLMNQRHLFELMQLTGSRNNGSSKRLSQIYPQNVWNINSDAIYRRNLHLIINNEHLHRLPIYHSFDDQQLIHSDFDYISSIKFDKMGSLFCAASTNGKIGIFDFDGFLSKWNNKVRIKYNSYIIDLQKENDNKLENGDDDITEIKQGGKEGGSLDNILEICIDTQFRIENVEWSDNMNDIAVCGHGGGCLNIYDLRRLSNKPKYKLRSNSKGHHPLITSRYSPKYGLNGMQLISSGDRMGNVWCWDLNNKSSKPCLKFEAISKQTTLIGNRFKSNMSNMNMSHFAVKHLHISKDGILIYVVRENGFIEIMDIRKPGYIFKTIDLWRCSFGDNHENHTNNIKNDKFYDKSLYANTSTAHRARIDDAIILESMNTALLKLQNNSLVNVHLESNIIRKTYSCHNNKEMINVTFLSKVMQRRMCSFERYGMPEIIVTGSFNHDMMTIDMSTELDSCYLEQEYREKRVKLGLMNNNNNNNNDNLNENISSSFRSAKSERVNEFKEYINKTELHEKSYGLMGRVELSDILTSCSLHPKSLYTVCGTLNNCLEIVACASNPF